MTIEKETKVARYIRAYHRQTESLAFEIQLPSDCLTFLSTVDFLQEEIDPLLYGLAELDADQVDYIHYHFFKEYIADPEYFDYFLECDAVPQSKVKTQEELIKQCKPLCVFVSQILDDNDFSEGSVSSLYLEELQGFVYTIYLQGVQDGRI